VDNTLLVQFVVAAFDGCTSFQDALLTLMVKTRPPPPAWSNSPARLHPRGLLRATAN
jgi:hypothetical protein